MNKIALLLCVTSMTVFMLIHSSCNAAGVGQLDSLKNQFLPAEYRNRNFTGDELKKMLLEKCKKATGTDNSSLYPEIEKGANTFMTCITGLVNISAIQEEIELARPIGELDTVFHKYCTKAPEAEKCLHTFNQQLQPCLSAAEKKQNAVLLRVATSLLGFMCAKGGDQIALFVAEQGPECMEANKEAITHCMNSSFAEFIPKDGAIDFLNLPEILLSPEHCVDFERFEKCTLHHLEQCQEITPANVAESIFKFVKNETSCKSWIDAKANQRSVLKQTRNAASLSTLSLIFVMMCTSLCLLLKNIL